ncbi:MAG: phosphatase PAP2 family protein, partial [Polaromonas sp.]|nr:phosphatase PAP2 family protein [Polaromonas sp.]
LVWGLKMTLERSRPVAMYAGAERFSFPSGHTASGIVLYGFLAFLLAHGRPPRIRFTITLLAAGLIVCIAFSRLYLGAHWLSDVLASLSLGTAWVALLSIAYLRYASTEHLPARALAFAASGALLVAGLAVVLTHHAADLARYAPRQAAPPVRLADWQQGGWQSLPERRTEVDGDHEEPLAVQWADTAGQIKQTLKAGGWRRPPQWTLRHTLLCLLPNSTAEQLPVLVKLHQGESPAMTFERQLDPSHRLVIRFWPTSYGVAGAANELPVALWSGMVTLERLERPAGLVTLAMTDQDFELPLRQLAKSLQSQGVHIDIRHRGTAAVLLVQE